MNFDTTKIFSWFWKLLVKISILKYFIARLVNRFSSLTKLFRLFYNFKDIQEHISNLKFSECGGTLGSGREKSGEIVVGRNIKEDENNISVVKYKERESCMWHITVPAGYHLKVWVLAIFLNNPYKQLYPEVVKSVTNLF